MKTVAGHLQTGRAEGIHASFIPQQFSGGFVKFLPKNIVWFGFCFCK